MDFHEAIDFAKKTKGAKITCTFWKSMDNLKDLRYLYYDEHLKPVLIGIDPNKNVIHDYAFDLLYLLDKEWEVFADPVYTQDVEDHRKYYKAVTRLLYELDKNKCELFVSYRDNQLDFYSPNSPIFIAHNPRKKVTLVMGKALLTGELARVILEYHHTTGELRISRNIVINIDTLDDCDENDWIVKKIFKTHNSFNFKEICQYCNFKEIKKVSVVKTVLNWIE